MNPATLMPPVSVYLFCLDVVEGRARRRMCAQHRARNVRMQKFDCPPQQQARSEGLHLVVLTYKAFVFVLLPGDQSITLQWCSCWVRNEPKRIPTRCSGDNEAAKIRVWVLGGDASNERTQGCEMLGCVGYLVSWYEEWEVNQSQGLPSSE